jgi:hypothetical protein
MRLSDALPERVEEGLRALKAIEPIGDVRIDGGLLRVRYDASCIGFKQIEALLAGAGLAPASGVWWRCKSVLYRFLDSNARSNVLSRGGACCGRPPSPWRGDDTT